MGILDTKNRRNVLRRYAVADHDHRESSALNNPNCLRVPSTFFWISLRPATTKPLELLGQLLALIRLVLSVKDPAGGCLVAS
jgi:hypothetical protein